MYLQTQKSKGMVQSTTSFKRSNKHYSVMLRSVVSDLIAGFGRETLSQIKSALLTQAVAG